MEVNQGDDCAGHIQTVGKNVLNFKPGDRVASFHRVAEPGGTYAEFAIVPSWTTFHIPDDVSFEQASTVPLTAATASVGLFAAVGGLGLPLPVQPAAQPLPLVIYGASGSVGSFALQLAKQARFHPLIAVAGGGAKQIAHLIDESKGDVVIDYRKGDAEVVKGIQSALKGIPLLHALDTASHGNSSLNIAQAMSKGGRIARTLPAQPGALPNEVQQIALGVSAVHGEQKDLGFVMFSLFGLGLKDGWLQARPYEVVDGGLEGVEGALKKLKEGKSTKYVFRIADTQGVLRHG